jgi:D-arginine dehydrogenase
VAARATEFDIMVVGAGMAGISCAGELAGGPRSVGVIDMYDRLPYAATARSSAFFAESYFSCVEFAALTAASRASYERPPPGFSALPLLAPRGALYLAGERDIKALGTLCLALGRSVARIDILDRAETLALVPILRPDYPVLAAFEPNACDIDVDAVYQGYARLARRRGATIVPGAELVAACWGGRRWSIETTAGRFAAEIIVNASGAWADLVAQNCRGEGAAGAPLGLRPLRRSVCLVRPELPAVDAIADDMPFVITAGEDCYFRYGGGRFLVSPANESPTVPRDEQPEAEEIACGIERFTEMTSVTLRPSLDRAWAGIRTFAPDRKPVIGFDERLPNFFWLAGQGGFGIQTAPAAARLAAALVEGRAVPPDIAAAGLNVAGVAPRRLRHSDSYHHRSEGADLGQEGIAAEGAA